MELPADAGLPDVDEERPDSAPSADDALREASADIAVPDGDPAPGPPK